MHGIVSNRKIASLCYKIQIVVMRCKPLCKYVSGLIFELIITFDSKESAAGDKQQRKSRW